MRSSEKQIVSVCRLTVNGKRYYPWESSEKIEVRFSKTGSSCTLPDGTVLRKIPGGRSGGNFERVDGGDVYRIWK